MSASTERAAGTDIILYDYPGRGGTTVPPTTDASLAFVPALARPFVRLGADPALARFDHRAYLVQAKAPVLLIVSEDDGIVRPRNMRDLAAQLRARGVEVTSVAVPGGHGTALRHEAALEAIRRFVRAHGG